MNRDRTRTPAHKARTCALRDARRISSTRKLMAFLNDGPASVTPGLFA